MGRVYPKEALVVGFFGGPGCGKSTLAAGLFHALKSEGVEAGLVLEAAKEDVYATGGTLLGNQFYLAAVQENRQWIMRGKVDVIVTDAPLMMATEYAPEEDKEAVRSMVNHLLLRYRNFNVIVKRTKPFVKYGRVHGEAASRRLDTAIGCAAIARVADPSTAGTLAVNASEEGIATVLTALREMFPHIFTNWPHETDRTQPW